MQETVISIIMRVIIYVIIGIVIYELFKKYKVYVSLCIVLIKYINKTNLMSEPRDHVHP